MLVVGLTGGYATGKSTVSAILKSSNIPVVDADLLARQIVEPGTPALKAIVKTFGHEVLLPDGTLNRKKLATIAYNDETKMKLVNKITHPAVHRALFWQAMRYWMRGHKYCVLDVPLLIEGGIWQWIGLVVVVYCSEEIQLQRLMQRDGYSREDAFARVKSQMSISEKVSYADIVIDNSGTRDELEAHVQSLIHELDAAAGWTWRISWVLPPVALLSAAWILLRRKCAKKRRLRAG